MTTPFPFGPEFLVNTTTASSQSQPTITALPDGRFVVAWTDNSATGGDTSNFAVRAQVFAADGAKLGAEVLVNTTTASSQSQPTITALPDGRFVVAWRDDSATGGDMSVSAVRAQIFAADGAKLGAEVLVNTTTASSQSQPTITALPDGRFVVAWRDDSATGGDTSNAAVRAQIFAADGAKLGAEVLVNTTTNSFQVEPTITALPDGRFVVAWRDDSATGGDTSNAAVRAQIFAADGAKLGAEVLVNTTTASSQSQPTITALPDGRFVVAWRDDSATGGDMSVSAVRAQIFAADGAKLGAEVLVNTTTNSFQVEPTITALPDGRFMVAWRDDSATGGDMSVSAVRAQIFAADGAKLGAEVLVNTTTAGIQSQPTITALPDGRFAVAWTDLSATGGDTSGAAVRAQVFDPRSGVIEVVSGAETQPRQLDSYDSLAVLPGASLLAQNAPAVVSDSAFATHGTVTVDGSVLALSSGPAVDAIRLDGTATGAGSGLGGHVIGIGPEGLVRSSGVGLSVVGAESRVVNAGYVESYGAAAVALAAGAGGTAWLVNTGTLVGGTPGLAVTGSAGVEILRNSGTIDGDVVLGGGNDSYRAQGAGTVAGTVRGEAGNDTLLGRAGDDTLEGGAGADQLRGRAGDDSLIGGSEADPLFGGAGADTLRGDAGTDGMNGGADDDLMFGGADADTLRGSGGDDFVYGDNGADLMFGGRGDDNMFGGNDNDRMSGGAGDDFLFGSLGVDTLLGGTGDDTLDGGGWNDVAHGGAGDDIVLGSLGNDTLSGGPGDDTVTGGNGADVFVYRRGHDLVEVTDFVDGADRIDLRSWGFVNFLDVQAQHDVTETTDGVVFDFGDGDILTVNGASIAGLSFPDFLF